MTDSENRAILAISLMAAFSDGDNQEREREEIRRIAEGLAPDNLLLPTLYQDVLTQRLTLETAVGELKSPASQHLAYEMAVCVCDADGAQSDAERRFLDRLRQAFAMPMQAGVQFNQMAESIATAPLAGAAAAPSTTASDAELDKMILNAAIMNGALELLPETLSTMAIIPLQMQLVYKIGKTHGYELDSGHVKDFLATAGVGLTSQFLEQAGRKLLGGLLGSIGGSLARGLGNQAVSSGMSFASTYALGHVAKRYYAGGRKLSTQMLKDTFERVMQEGRSLQGEYLPAMREKARGLDPSRLLALVRGQ
ncbi:MAG: GTPase [Usitatibacter sp.]